MTFDELVEAELKRGVNRTLDPLRDCDDLHAAAEAAWLCCTVIAHERPVDRLRKELAIVVAMARRLVAELNLEGAMTFDALVREAVEAGQLKRPTCPANGYAAHFRQQVRLANDGYYALSKIMPDPGERDRVYMRNLLVELGAMAQQMAENLDP